MTGSQPAGRAIQDSGAPIERSAPKPRKRGGRRGRRSQLLGRLNALSRERQEAWAEEHHLSLEEFRRAVESGQRDLTRALTSKLDSGFDELRRTDPVRGEDYRGKTSGVRG